jgi:glycosyltransferase involved in cell wall biosynthesis
MKKGQEIREWQAKVDVSTQPFLQASQSEDVSAPRISVVIPSLNQARFLRWTLNSIVNQRYANIEVIVIDGGSRDDTVQVLRDYDKVLAYWESVPDRGQSHALNKGFRRATGQIYAWQNADDLYLPNVFADVADVFRRHPRHSVVFGDHLEIDGLNAVLCREYAFDIRWGQLVFEGLTCNAQAMFWRREVHERFGFFDERLTYTMDHDMLLGFVASEGYEAFYRLNSPLACFRRHKDQKTRGFNSRVAAEHRMIAEKLGTGNICECAGVRHAFYRLRRAWWYSRRAGLAYAVVRAIRCASFHRANIAETLLVPSITEQAGKDIQHE